MDLTEWGRWSTGNCARNWNFTIYIINEQSRICPCKKKMPNSVKKMSNDNVCQKFCFKNKNYKNQIKVSICFINISKTLYIVNHQRQRVRFPLYVPQSKLKLEKYYPLNSLECRLVLFRVYICTHSSWFLHSIESIHALIRMSSSTQLNKKSSLTQVQSCTHPSANVHFWVKYID